MILIKGKNLVLASALVLGVMSMQTATANNLSEVNTNTALFSVAHVKQNDNLNVRAGAGVSNEIVTTIPFDGGGIELLGDETSIGKTNWVLIKWKGITGWVSKYYLDAQETAVLVPKENLSPVEIALGKENTSMDNNKESVKSVVVDSDVSVNNIADETAASETEAPSAPSAQSVEENENNSLESKDIVDQDVWVLRCGNKMPYWKVDLHSKRMEVLKGDYETDLRITKKKQDRNRWNTALKTIVHGKNGRNNLQMTIKYAYSKRCYDTLSGLRVPYKVSTKFNGEELTGCCRAVKLEPAKLETAKVSMK